MGGGPAGPAEVNVNAEATKFETGGKNGGALSQTEILAETRKIRQQFGDDEAGYRRTIDAIYNRIYDQARTNAALGNILPQLDLADASVDPQHVGSDRGDFSGRDGRKYDGVGTASGRATSVMSSDGQSGMVTGPDGQVTAFTTNGDGLTVDGNKYHHVYGPGYSINGAPGPDGVIHIKGPNNATIDLHPDGIEVTHLGTGAEIDREHPDGRITHYYAPGDTEHKNDLVKPGMFSKTWNIPGMENVPVNSPDVIVGDDGKITYTVHGQKHEYDTKTGGWDFEDNLPTPFQSCPNRTFTGFDDSGNPKFKVGEAEITLKPNGDFTQVHNGKTYEYVNKGDGNWTMMEAGTGHQILSIHNVQIGADGSVTYNPKVPWLD
jgi:hypothetical protein